MLVSDRTFGAPANQNTPAERVRGDTPDIEANRADYERLADCLVTMLDCACARPGAGLLDIAGAVVEDRLRNAIEGHFADLWAQMDWLNPVTIRRFYVEMRMHVDALVSQRDEASPPS